MKNRVVSLGRMLLVAAGAVGFVVIEMAPRVRY